MAVSRLLEELKSLNADLDVPSPCAFGIAEPQYMDLIPTMVAQAIGSGSPANNPRNASAEQIAALYREAFA